MFTLITLNCCLLPCGVKLLLFHFTYSLCCVSKQLPRIPWGYDRLPSLHIYRWLVGFYQNESVQEQLHNSRIHNPGFHIQHEYWVSGVKTIVWSPAHWFLYTPFRFQVLFCMQKLSCSLSLVGLVQFSWLALKDYSDIC